MYSSDCCGERGVKLSEDSVKGLELQGLSIKNHRFYFLMKQQVLRYLYRKKTYEGTEKMPEDLTIIIIAHRLTTLKTVNSFKSEKGKLRLIDKKQSFLS